MIGSNIFLVAFGPRYGGHEIEVPDAEPYAKAIGMRIRNRASGVSASAKDQRQFLVANHVVIGSSLQNAVDGILNLDCCQLEVRSATVLLLSWLTVSFGFFSWMLIA